MVQGLGFRAWKFGSGLLASSSPLAYLAYLVYCVGLRVYLLSTQHSKNDSRPSLEFRSLSC